MSLIEKIDTKKIPQHIAITMDGNGRWAKEKGKLRIFGHQNGVKAVREAVEGSVEIGIKYLTLYAFSEENWKRPEKEVNALMRLLVSTIANERKTLIDNDIQLRTIGSIDSLPEQCKNELDNTMKITKANSKMTLILALSYSSRSEIIKAIKELLQQQINHKDIDEKLFEQYLYTKNVPDPELVIRTSGEKRISNFMLWQIAYSELYFTDTLWPDFRRENLYRAIIDYQKRERRFGKITEQIKN